MVLQHHAGRCRFGRGCAGLCEDSRALLASTLPGQQDHLSSCSSEQRKIKLLPVPHSWWEAPARRLLPLGLPVLRSSIVRVSPSSEGPLLFVHIVNLFLHTTFPLFTIHAVENSKTGRQLPETSLNSRVSESSDGTNGKLRVLGRKGSWQALGVVGVIVCLLKCRQTAAAGEPRADHGWPPPERHGTPSRESKDPERPLDPLHPPSSSLCLPSSPVFTIKVFLSQI